MLYYNTITQYLLLFFKKKSLFINFKNNLYTVICIMSQWKGHVLSILVLSILEVTHW